MTVNLSSEERAQYAEMSTSEKIAILLVQIGEDLTATLFSQMNIESVTEISAYIAQAKNNVSKKIATAILEEFNAIFQSNQYINTGGMEYAKEILYKALGKDAAQRVLEKLSRNMQTNRNFAYLDNIKPEQLADFIINEHPQTIALILAHMDSTSAAETISRFSDDLRSEVAMRMANLGDVSPSVIKRVSTVLETKLESLATLKVEVGGPKAVADIFNKLGTKPAKATLAHIEQIDDELATSIKDKMFTFEDIVNLDTAAIRDILTGVDKKELMLSLKSAGEGLKDKFFSCMSNRAKEGFLEEIQFMGAVKLKEVEAAQRKIVEFVQQLAEQGKVQLGETDEMIE